MKTMAYTALALPLASLAQAETVQVNGHDVYYELHGDLGTGAPPMVLLHGGMMSFEASFGNLVEAFANRFAIIGVEQQGHGHTPLNDTPISLETMRQDTLGVLDALSVDKAHVIGFSAGGILALELAVNAPERVASVVAISAASGPQGFIPDLMRMQRDPTFVPPPEILSMMPSEADFAAMSADIAAKNPGGAGAAKDTHDKISVFIASDWGWPDARVAEIAAPVLLMVGDRDFIQPGHALHLYDTIPDAKLAILPATTLLSILGWPGLGDMILDFVATTLEPAAE